MYLKRLKAFYQVQDFREISEILVKFLVEAVQFFLLVTRFLIDILETKGKIRLSSLR